MNKTTSPTRLPHSLSRLQERAGESAAQKHYLVPLLLACATCAQAQTPIADPTPAQYFACQIAARQATINGLQERLSMAQISSASPAEQQAQAERARTLVSIAFNDCGYTVNTLSAYAHRAKTPLQTWLQTHPTVQTQLDDTAKRIANISAQMPARSTPPSR
jgi:hypothetical protein